MSWVGENDSVTLHILGVLLPSWVSHVVEEYQSKDSDSMNPAMPRPPDDSKDLTIELVFMKISVNS